MASRFCVSFSGVWGGILDIFKAAAPDARQFLNYFPKVKFFLQADNFARYIKPLKGTWKRNMRVTLQGIAKTFLVPYEAKDLK